MSSASEPRNPLYMLLLLVGVLFVVTAVAYALIPILQDKAIEQGEVPPPSPFRDALRQDGGTWILWELAVLVVLGIASMVLDRLRSLQKATGHDTISPNERSNSSP
jgi:amino acid transporter